MLDFQALHIKPFSCIHMGYVKLMIIGSQAGEKDKKKKPQYLYLCTVKTHYVVVKKACKQLGFKMTEDENFDWDLYWCDTGGILPE